MSQLLATRRLLHAALLVGLPALAALLFRSWIPSAAMVPILGVILVAFLEVLLPLPLAMSRNIDLGDRLLVGDEAKIEVNVTPAPLPQNLLLDDGIPEGFLVPTESREALAPTLTGGARTQYVLKPRRRGEYVFTSATFRRVGMLGLFERKVDVPAETRITVIPAGAKQLGVRVRPRPPQRQGPITRSLRRGPGDEFRSLREYLPGDSLGDVNWKATARLNRIITNEFLPEEPPRVLLYVDTRATTAEVGEADAFERTLELSSILIEALLDARAHVGLVMLSYHSVFLVPGGGAPQLRRLRQMVIDAQPGQDAPLLDLVLAGVPHLPSRADAILLTSNVYDPSLGPAVTFLRGHHGHVSVLFPGFPEPAGNQLDKAAQRAAGSLLNAEQAAAAAALRKLVDYALTWPPDEPVSVTLSRLGMTGRTR